MIGIQIQMISFFPKKILILYLCVNNKYVKSSIIYSQWRQTDQSISAMALVVFLPRPESILIGPLCWSILFHKIPRPALLALVIIRPVWRHCL